MLLGQVDCELVQNLAVATAEGAKEGAVSVHDNESELVLCMQERDERDEREKDEQERDDRDERERGVREMREMREEGEMNGRDERERER